jgi:hypothetical protein
MSALPKVFQGRQPLAEMGAFLAENLEADLSGG